MRAHGPWYQQIRSSAAVLVEEEFLYFFLITFFTCRLIHIVSELHFLKYLWFEQLNQHWSITTPKISSQYNGL